MLSRLSERLRGWFSRSGHVSSERPPKGRGRTDHVIILDGTMSTLEEGLETNAGITFKLLREARPGARLSLRYEAGIQWSSWAATRDVIEGRGINRQIRRAYGALASRYRPGDRIFLIGYSRGAYAARSLAGMIDLIGLLRAEHATERMTHLAYRHYRNGAGSTASQAFSRQLCHEGVEIEAVALWDTVKSLGLRAPVLWRLTEPRHAFHSHRLGQSTRHGFHALALDETREVYAPVLWASGDDHDGHVEQMWFRGTHGDVGGHLSGFGAARPLANISLVWLLERLCDCGLPLPDGWRARFPMDAAAPSLGLNRGVGRLFLLRKRREIGADPSEKVHPSAAGHPLAEGLPVGEL